MIEDLLIKRSSEQKNVWKSPKPKMVGIDDGNQRWPNRTLRKCAGIRAIKGTKRIRRGTSELIKKGGLQIGSSKILERPTLWSSQFESLEVKSRSRVQSRRKKLERLLKWAEEAPICQSRHIAQRGQLANEPSVRVDKKCLLKSLLFVKVEVSKSYA